MTVLLGILGVSILMFVCATLGAVFGAMLAVRAVLGRLTQEKISMADAFDALIVTKEEVKEKYGNQD